MTVLAEEEVRAAAVAAACAERTADGRPHGNL